MDTPSRNSIIRTITEREVLRPIGRVERLLRHPFRTFPYYLLATAGHIKPFPLTFKTLWGGRMTSYLPEGNTFYYYGYCEANVANFFLRYIQDGMTCVDIGAHVGYYSMLLSELVGESGSVHSFEPTPWTFTLLRKNTGALKNVSITNRAVSDTPEKLTFADYGPGYGAYNTAHANGAAALHKSPKMETVESITLDSYCAEKAIIPNLVKIDAEGFEYRVLGGMKQLCTQTDIRPLLIFEVAGGADWKENREQSFSLLAEYGYQPYEISTSGLLSPHTLKQEYDYDNLLFVPDDRTTEVTPFLI